MQSKGATKMLQVSENSEDSQCHVKAKNRGQKTFTLVEQDKSAVRTIAFWILENIETSPEDKLRKALEDCLVMRKFPNRKNPD